jgi:hypothetical protein
MYTILMPADVNVIACYASHWVGNYGGISGEHAYGRLTNHPYLAVANDGTVTDVDCPIEITGRGWEMLGEGLSGMTLSDFCYAAFTLPDQPPIAIDVAEENHIAFDYANDNSVEIVAFLQP